MTAYTSWTISGYTVPWIRAVKNDQAARTITLACTALSTDGSEPRDEIAVFEALTCDVVNNTQLMNGGSCLEVCNGDPVLVSDGHDTWVAALERVVINEGKISDRRIDYDLVIHYETTGDGMTYAMTGGNSTFTPSLYSDAPDINDLRGAAYMWPYCSYPSVLGTLVYNEFTDGTSSSNPNCSTIGKIVITQTRDVKTVIVEGYSIKALPSYIEVNGQRQYWVHTQYDGSNPGQDLLTFTLDTPAKTVTIQSSTHVSGDGNGCMIASIRVMYE